MIDLEAAGISKILLAIVLLSGCNAPRLARKPRFFLPDTQELGLIRLHKEGEKCEGEIIPLSEDRQACVIPLRDAERLFSCLPNEDVQMLVEYQSELIRSCKRWRKKR